MAPCTISRSRPSLSGSSPSLPFTCASAKGALIADASASTTFIAHFHGKHRHRPHRPRLPRLPRRGHASSGKILNGFSMNNPTGWIQFALFVGALLLVTKPLGLYLWQVLDARRANVARSDREAARTAHVSPCAESNPEQEQNWKRLRLLRCCFQPRRAAVHLRHPALPASAAAQSAESGRRRARPRVQHRGQFHHQHQLAELRRRIDHELFLADGRADISQLGLGGHRHRHRRGARARHRAAHGHRPSATSGPISCASTSICSLPICLVYAIFLVRRA